MLILNIKLICLFQRGHKSNVIDKITFTERYFSATENKQPGSGVEINNSRATASVHVPSPLIAK